MKRVLYPLLFISVLIYWGCEEEEERQDLQLICGVWIIQ